MNLLFKIIYNKINLYLLIKLFFYEYNIYFIYIFYI